MLIACIEYGTPLLICCFFFSILGRIIRITDAAVDERVHALQSGLWMAYPCEPALSNIYPDNTIPDLIQLYQQQSTQQQIQQQITPGTVSYCNQWVNQNGYTQFVQQPILIVGSPLVEGLGRLGSVGASEHDQQSAEDGTELPRVQVGVWARTPFVLIYDTSYDLLRNYLRRYQTRLKQGSRF